MGIVTWNHINVGKLFVIDRNTWYHIIGQTNIHRKIKKSVIRKTANHWKFCYY